MISNYGDWRWLLVLLIIGSFLYYFVGFKNHLGSIEGNIKGEKYTIRVNTFRRLDSLRLFLNHYSKCKDVQEIQIVWSDQLNHAPTEWTKDYNKHSNKVLFEIHTNNSLNNRFLSKLPIKTEAVLSMDDDLIGPCDLLSLAFRVWKSNKRVLVGFSPRLHAWDTTHGSSEYLRWQHTWWNGFYSIVLTKAAFFHRDFLSHFQKYVPSTFLRYVDSHRNCEDIAMAYVVAALSKAPPVWVKGEFQESAAMGISSGEDHFRTRSHCLDELEQLTQSGAFIRTGLPVSSESDPHSSVRPRPNRMPWVLGYQKIVRMSIFHDYFSLLYDTKG